MNSRVVEDEAELAPRKGPVEGGEISSVINESSNQVINHTGSWLLFSVQMAN